jgi:hypothetical protein
MLRKKVKKKVLQNDIINEDIIKQPPAESSLDEMADVSTIEEFLERKKLENRILEKILDKMNQSERNK